MYICMHVRTCTEHRKDNTGVEISPNGKKQIYTVLLPHLVVVVAVEGVQDHWSLKKDPVEQNPVVMACDGLTGSALDFLQTQSPEE